MFVKASWIAIVAALCVAQAHVAQATKPENAWVGTSTLIRDASGNAIGSSAVYYDKDGNVVDRKTTYFTETPAAAPAVVRESEKSADAPAAKPENAWVGTSTLIRDASGNAIGSSAVYYDKDGNVVDRKTTYFTETPAAAPAVVRESEKSADAPAAKPENAWVGTSTLIRDASGNAIGSSAVYYDKDGNVVDRKTTYFTETPAAAPAVVRESEKSADAPAAKPAGIAFGTSTIMRAENGSIIGSETSYGTVIPAAGATA